MRSAHIAMLMLAASPAAHADFSFTMTQKSGPGGDQIVKHYVKGQKEKEERGTIATIVDFDAQTLTTIDTAAKTYKVVGFSDMANAGAASVDVQADVKSTGQKKTINGFNASQVILTMQVDMPQARPAGIKAKMEVELWLSRDVPGSQELAAFYKKNAAHWPVGASGGGNPSMQKAMAKLQQQFAEMDGVPVMEVIRMKSGGGAGPSAAQTQQMAQARAQLEAIAKRGGPQGAAAQQTLAGMSDGLVALFEITMEAGNFSSSAIPDSAFEVPAGYRKLGQ
ncbi:MAG: DUF4412 domain-containing protein [Bryobacteraceae bacterium]